MSTYAPRRHRRRLAASAAAVLTVALTGALAACSGSATSDTASPDHHTSRPPSAHPARAGLHMVEHHGHKLAFHVTPGHLPAIVLDAGGGLDSSQWKKIAPALAEKTGSEIITYDRAGAGKSDDVDGAWNAEDAASDLEAGLTRLGVRRNVVLVSHSQAGEVATYFVRAHQKQVAGVVLVDASLPEFYTDRETARIEAANQAQVAQLKGKPKTRQTRQLLSTADNYGPMHRAYHKVSWPRSVPATAIVSATTPFEPPEDAQHWRDAQKQFADAASNRTRVVAAGSSHDIPADRPQVVVKAVEKMVRAHG